MPTGIEKNSSSTVTTTAPIVAPISGIRSVSAISIARATG
jgi:hypothetical protein